MKIKSIKEIKNLKGKRVLVRVDFNVPLVNGGVGASEDFRIVSSLPTIKYLIAKKAKIILMAHLGRPDGQVNLKYSLKPVVRRLEKLLNKKITLSPEVIGNKTKELVDSLKNGEILILENVRFHPREEMNCKKLARKFSELGDIFVNDAFAVSHRAQSSVSAIAEILPAYAGFLMENEINFLNKALKNPKKPLIVIIGGAKISTKIKVIKNFSKVSDKILLGGALANTVLMAKGISVGKSPIEEKMFKEVNKFKLTDNQIVVPVDGLMAVNKDDNRGRVDAMGDVKKDELVLDIGPETILLYKNILEKAKMIVWNGPMGLIENPVFVNGTKKLIKILAESKAETIVGGGETVQIIRKMKLENKFSFISTGGGAMLEFLEGKKLPGLKNIIK